MWKELPSKVSVSTDVHLPAMKNSLAAQQLMTAVATCMERAAEWRELNFALHEFKMLPVIKLRTNKPDYLNITITTDYELHDKTQQYIASCIGKKIEHMLRNFDCDNGVANMLGNLRTAKMDDVATELINKIIAATRSAHNDEISRRSRQTVTEVVAVGDYELEVSIYQRQMAANKRTSIRTRILCDPDAE